MKEFAFLFPGQGSQIVGMGQSFLTTKIGQETFQEASESLGFDLQKLCMEGPADELTLTQNAQPAILTVSTIASRLFQEKSDIKAKCAAGHSLGEYSALVASGVLSFKDAVKAVHLRGKFMQAAVPVGIGGMAAILGMDAPTLEELCAAISTPAAPVAPANYNCKGQIVISGELGAVKKVLESAKGKLLDVSAPFHSAMMTPAADNLAAELDKIQFNDAAFAIINNADNDTLQSAKDFQPSLIKQLTAPVRWETGVQKMIAEGVDSFIEFGEGKVLAGMMKRIDKTKKVINLSNLESIENLPEDLAVL